MRPKAREAAAQGTLSPYATSKTRTCRRGFIFGSGTLPRRRAPRFLIFPPSRLVRLLIYCSCTQTRRVPNRHAFKRSFPTTTWPFQSKSSSRATSSGTMTIPPSSCGQAGSKSGATSTRFTESMPLATPRTFRARGKARIANALPPRPPSAWFITPFHVR